jgi:hypothetical protein
VSSGVKNNVNAGNHTVSETQQPGYSQTITGDCASDGTITLALGDDKSCTITNNDISPTLTVNKVCAPTTDTGLFKLRIDGVAFGGDATTHDSACGGSTGAIPVNAGAHTVSEAAGAGTSLADYVTTINGDCSAAGAVTLALAQNKTCTITNTRKAMVTVVKTENGQAPTLQYTFTLSGGPDNVSLSRTTTVNDNPVGSGNLDFGKLKPGTYTFCETLVPAGTTSTLQMVAGFTTNMTTGDICGSITLAPGETRPFVIDNMHPLGGQRTIGYWKNWNTCAGSKGNQVQNAAKTGHALVDDLLPINLFGSFQVTTCAKAVEILSNSSGKYAEHALAAQLLAALLNKAVAGGAACTAANQAIQQAQLLLVQINWNGGVNTKIVGSNHPRRAEFNLYASQLDKFNNGLLC